MFVRDFIHVERPFQRVAPQFLRDPRWLHPIVDEAVGEAARVSHALAGSTDGIDAVTNADIRLDTTPAGVRLERGAVRSRAHGLVVPISWSHVVDPTWFPPISGDLEIAPIGLSRTELVLTASYQAAGSSGDSSPDRRGDALDEAPSSAGLPDPMVVMHRVVEAGVRAFLQHLAVALEAEFVDGPRR